MRMPISYKIASTRCNRSFPVVVEYHVSSVVHFSLSCLISFLSVLGLRCCAWAFSHCGGSFCCRAQASVVAHGCSCLAACGIFLEQELNPWPCTGRQILIHCTTREVLFLISLWELYFGTLSYILQVFFSLLFYLYIYIYKHIWLANDCFCYIQFFFFWLSFCQVFPLYGFWIYYLAGFF